MSEAERIYKKVRSLISHRNKSSYIGEDDYVSLVKGGITINYHIKDPHLDVENIFRAVKRAQHIVKDRLALNLKKMDIDIYSSMQEMRQEGRSRSRYASWIAGIYDGRIRVISDRENDDQNALYIILTHEIVHLAVYEMTKGACPFWLDEGLAVYISQELPDAYLSKLQKAVAGDRIFPLETLETPLPSDIEEGARQLAYSEMSSIVEFLIDSYGWEQVTFIMGQSRKRPIKKILTDLSLNYYLVEQGWKRWFRKKYA